jgi:hypothetical protein
VISRRIVDALGIVLLLESMAEAGGSWRGQVVDAETGQPLEGVVVLAMFWLRGARFSFGHESRDFDW